MPSDNQEKNSSEYLKSIFQYSQNYAQDITSESFFGYPLSSILKGEQSLKDSSQKSVGYFSMEFGIAPSLYHPFIRTNGFHDSNNYVTYGILSNAHEKTEHSIGIDKILDIPIYGGGLGVLAGDALKSCSDLKLSVVGVGILWNKGYFRQRLELEHGQSSFEQDWDPSTYPGLVPLNEKVVVQTNHGSIYLRIWKYYIYSQDKKHACPIILLDSDCGENSNEFRRLTDQLYRSDDISFRVYQRVILGVGGMKAVKSQNYSLDYYHLNEGHAAFSLIEAFEHFDGNESVREELKKFVYTCHTPVAAGHDRFMCHDINQLLPKKQADISIAMGRDPQNDQDINLTTMCLEKCSKVNAVAQKHGHIMHLQFPQYKNKIKAITNGIHIPTWISKSMKDLFDQYKDCLGDWRYDPLQLERILKLKSDKVFRQDLWTAHQKNKKNLTAILSDWNFDPDCLTLCWARRFAGYKRPGLLFNDLEQLVKISKKNGPLQVLIAGKAHPNDLIGSARIHDILKELSTLSSSKQYLKIFIIENYDTYFGKLLTSCVDVWLNNPLPPFEASGTSGMKAILNGVLQLSTLDGWVVESKHDDIGWIFGYQHEGDNIGNEQDLRLIEDSKLLYNTLEEVLGLYYQTNKKGKVNLESAWIDKMICCIASSSFFNTQRMINEYNNLIWS